MSVPDALLFVSGHCPNCPAVLAALIEMVKAGTIGRLTVVNVEQHPEAAREHGVRSVPWVRIGPFELTGLRSRRELEDWAAKAGTEAGLADWFHALLEEGALDKVLETARRDPAALAAVLPIVADPEANIHVRIGAAAALEAFAGLAPLQALLPRLAGLAGHEDARVRADACHYLALTHLPEARSALAARLEDADADVREIAREGLEEP
jgi:thioredoxin-like negative regulator of GroEL